MFKYYTLLLFTFLHANVHANIIFDVDFENPPHVLGSAPVTGTASDRPFETQLVIIDSGISSLSGQVARFTSSGMNAGLSFPSQIIHTSGLHSISWDAVMLTLDASDGLQVDSRVDFEGVGSLNMSMLVNNDIRVSDPVSGSSIIGSWVLGEVQHFEALLNLDADTYDFFLDGNKVISDSPLTPNDGITSFVFQRPFVTSEFATDNFSWVIVPEPSTLFLFLGGAFLLVLRRSISIGRSEES